MTLTSGSFTNSEIPEVKKLLIKGVTLRGLEVFEALASTGSVAQAADMTGLSQPAVSQQLRNLESALGTELVDHSRRPMRVTPPPAITSRAPTIPVRCVYPPRADVRGVLSTSIVRV